MGDSTALVMCLLHLVCPRPKVLTSEGSLQPRSQALPPFPPMSLDIGFVKYLFTGFVTGRPEFNCLITLCKLATGLPPASRDF